MEFRKEYKLKLKAGFQSMPIGAINDMESTVNPKNREIFIEIVKELIDEGFGNDQGWIMEMNSNYLKYRKIAHGFKPKANEAIKSPVSDPTHETAHTITDVELSDPSE